MVDAGQLIGAEGVTRLLRTHPRTISRRKLDSVVV